MRSTVAAVYDRRKIWLPLNDDPSAVIDRRYNYRSSSLFAPLLIIFPREEQRHRFGK
jgi:hypothetical protein